MTTAMTMSDLQGHSL